MKGIILAGGRGTRLFPLTAVTNKHLAPVGVLPMIEYPLYTLTRMGIRDISLVTGGEHFSDIARYLGELHPDINFSFHYQKEAGGIAQALSLAKSSVGDNKMAVILGDNIFEDNFRKVAQEFEKSSGAFLFLKNVPDPERFGVAEVEGNEVVGIEEKPKNPKSSYAVTGLYFYDPSVFKKIDQLRPSARGEYEITDVNNRYISNAQLTAKYVGGFWSDAGTVGSRKLCEGFVQRNGLEEELIKELAKNPEIRRNLEEAFGEIL